MAKWVCHLFESRQSPPPHTYIYSVLFCSPQCEMLHIHPYKAQNHMFLQREEGPTGLVVTGEPNTIGS